jgi:diguanylate cyclase (GGDEF)-like protein
MKIDLFENEQKIYDEAMNREEAVRNGEAVCFSEYLKLAREYGKLLKQLRRATRMADRTAADLYESNLDLADKARYDALTGIYNRRYMEDNLKRVISSIKRSGGGQLSFLMLDIDHFKNYNDAYGHGEGDACLKTVAETIRNSLLRVDDFAARYGGEEFAVVLPNTDRNGARVIAERILENVRALNIPHPQNEAGDRVTISIGMTTGEVMFTQKASDYINRADQALYASKRDGRNRYTYMDL